MNSIKAWALTRDGVLFMPNWQFDGCIYRTRAAARANRDLLKPGSKHRWAVVRVRVVQLSRDIR